MAIHTLLRNTAMVGFAPVLIYRLSGADCCAGSKALSLIRDRHWSADVGKLFIRARFTVAQTLHSVTGLIPRLLQFLTAVLSH